MKLPKLSFLLLLLSLVIGCKSSKTLTTTGVLSETMTAKQIIRENSKNEVRFKTLKARVKVDYANGDQSQSHTVSLRMEKDKTIWLNAGVSGISLARTMITPDKVGFYDKINNQYFEGDYSILSNLLGIDLDFNKVQNLLLGEAIFSLNNDTYTASVNDKSYVLQPNEQKAVLELFFLLNPGHFKLDSQQLYQASKKRFLQIDYGAYQVVNRQMLPKTVKILAVEDGDEVSIDMEFKSVSLNQEIRFPFKIPSGFTEIVIDDAK